MKDNFVLMVLSVFIMGGFFYIICYFFEDYSVSKNLTMSLFFGLFWGLAEIFFFKKLRAKSKKDEHPSQKN